MKRIKFFHEKPRRNLRKESLHIDILNWLSIWENSNVYFDGKRKFGYGGYEYDGRWKKIVKKLTKEYKLDENSNLLDIGCAKGFLVNDFEKARSVGNATGLDISLYALIKGKRCGMKGYFVCGNMTKLPFKNNEFKIVFCKDSIHNILAEKEVIKSLSEIERVGKKKWIRVGAYNSLKQKKTIDDWAVLASFYCSVKEWKKIFDKAGYTGDYDWFHPTDIIEDE